MSEILVAYFSATGITEKLAKKIANVVDGDLHEIHPEIPYSAADLDWMNKNSRSSVEMNDKLFRPAIANKLESTENIKILILAFPIWWYIAPTIINTFLEQYDWNDKIIIPVATSGSSGMGNTNAELESSCPGAILKDGKRFDVNVSEKEIKAWFESLRV
ncbi:flavodoxin [Blautia sp. OF01-4LB]|uniref:flavodoxin n=1 Tax=Blautia sp. OF01-4LB TaxID=2292286 RepID=UPI000E510583|nr:flavodoxin [Blautia sp. OF01-4LB]RHP77014.1 flavodoxin [Blautia sp. OF01-4LB]